METMLHVKNIGDVLAILGDEPLTDVSVGDIVYNKDTDEYWWIDYIEEISGDRDEMKVTSLHAHDNIYDNDEHIIDDIPNYLKESRTIDYTKFLKNDIVTYKRIQSELNRVL